MVIAVHRQAEGKKVARRYESREHVVTETDKGLEIELFGPSGIREGVVHVPASHDTEVYVMNGEGNSIMTYRWSRKRVRA